MPKQPFLQHFLLNLFNNSQYIPTMTIFLATAVDFSYCHMSQANNKSENLGLLIDIFMKDFLH